MRMDETPQQNFVGTTMGMAVSIKVIIFMCCLSVCRHARQQRPTYDLSAVVGVVALLSANGTYSSFGGKLRMGLLN